MKKLSLVLLAIFCINIANVTAQTDATTENIVVVEEVETTDTDVETLKCTKTGKICSPNCKNKAKGTCCKGKKKSCSKSKNKNGGFNFNKTNNYSGKSSCSKKIKQCSEDCTKKCCVSAPPALEATPVTTEEVVEEE